MLNALDENALVTLSRGTVVCFHLFCKPTYLVLSFCYTLSLLFSLPVSHPYHIDRFTYTMYIPYSSSVTPVLCHRHVNLYQVIYCHSNVVTPIVCFVPLLAALSFSLVLYILQSCCHFSLFHSGSLSVSPSSALICICKPTYLVFSLYSSFS